MAWTNAIVSKTVFGNKRVHVLSCTADSATDNIDTGLKVVEFFTVGPQSLSTGAPKIFANVGSAGTALVGYLGASGFASGDVLFITVYGR